MKACSFVPAATRMIYDMGLEAELSAVTFECPSDRPKVVRSVLEGNHYTSDEIDRIVSEYAATGKSLYYVDMELLQSVEPDVAFTQSVCDVCQIGTSYVERALGSLSQFPKVVPLIPTTLEDIFDNAVSIAEALNHPEAGKMYIADLKVCIARVIDELRAHGAPLRRVMVMEWMNPIYNCGHWIPYQIAVAGGVDMLSNPSGYSIVTPWEKVVQYNPEVLVVAPCGFDVARAAEEVSAMTNLPGWGDLTAVSSNHVYVADANMFTQPSASTIVDGIEVLAALFHPDIFEVPSRLRDKVAPLSDLLHSPTIGRV
ncbi:ABC transporter substrate-binding protein [Alicyclobacillus sp. ALC3]|uniref:ABC transporter substrate-binding protein n=1 Tax=Alicyclobacillus sp. ALC3 TaxID=2796143 RepID=UPI002379F23C|nr:ABC transporter substrate-binding protein [Alicyclobacillus sp. ALC3]WDL96801.1 ABC transporter substrate-binding protein [Alicyclobacillus sp. ALC3]